MDRFKFRGRAIDDGSGFDGIWITGYYRPNPINKERGKVHRWNDKYGWEGIAVDPETVGQCTGLKDKKGKLIYEGDILTWLGYTGKVHWKIFRWCFDKDSLTISTAASSEVIGNIHEAESE